MKAALLTVLLGCFCGANAAVEVPVKSDVDMKRLAGKWYPIWTAKREPGEIPIHAYTIEPLPNGDIALKVEIPQDGDCKLQRIVVTKVKNGVFQSPDGQGPVTLVDTDYDTYYVGHFLKQGTHLLHLYAKKKEVSDAVKQKYLTFVKKLGLDPNQLFFRREADMCKSPPKEA